MTKLRIAFLTAPRTLVMLLAVSTTGCKCVDEHKTTDTPPRYHSNCGYILDPGCTATEHPSPKLHSFAVKYRFEHEPEAKIKRR